jgi:hypothetical protein
MIIEINAGHIDKTSIRDHPIRNLLIKSIGWKTLDLYIGSELITKICNNSKDIRFVLDMDNDYNINLKVNNLVYYSNRNLFSYKIKIDIDDNLEVDDIIKYTEEYIYDG